MTEKYILDGHKVVPCDDLITWGKWLENIDARRVASNEKGDVKVSTVFLGLNHRFGDGPPLLFETMIFGGPYDQNEDRYSTWEEAEAGHKRMCEKAFEVKE